LGEAKWGEESRADLPELDDELPLGLENADEDGEHHRVAPEYAPDYLRRGRTHQHTHINDKSASQLATLMAACAES